MRKTQDQLFKEMCPELQGFYEKFYMRMYEEGLPFELNEVLRIKDTQLAYYAQGRDPLVIVNAKRKLAGLYYITEKENSYKVTWTLNSKHFPRQKDGLAMAFDIRLLRYGKPHWETKWDGNKDSVPDYLEAARIGQEVGLETGGLWKKPDFPHFQIKGV